MNLGAENTGIPGQQVIRAALFDYDGTLAPVEGPKRSSITKAAQFFVSLGAEPNRSLGILMEVEDEMEAQGLFNRVQWWREVARRLGVKIDEESATKLTEEYWETWKNESAVFPEAPSVLMNLKKGGLKLGLVANTDGTPGMKLSRVKKDVSLDLFDVVVIAGDDVKETKPHPHPFLYALSKLGLNADQAIFFGDDPAFDVPGAKNAGLVTAIITRSAYLKEKPDLVIGCLTEIPNLLSKSLLIPIK
ncbi:MAG: HAD family hydrolase [Thermoprotei archaeon]